LGPIGPKAHRSGKKRKEKVLPPNQEGPNNKCLYKKDKYGAAKQKNKPGTCVLVPGKKKTGLTGSNDRGKLIPRYNGKQQGPGPQSKKTIKKSYCCCGGKGGRQLGGSGRENANEKGRKRTRESSRDSTRTERTE